MPNCIPRQVCFCSVLRQRGAADKSTKLQLKCQLSASRSRRFAPQPDKTERSSGSSMCILTHLNMGIAGGANWNCHNIWRHSWDER
jgi:hypothetical protein